ncbi:MAG TPA: anhydro-N-acetylmuramic acid kinase [Paenalcaligenes sp.]|nr:anhydro-N-acetylmuramic acid kinase [Paenalcaligenes sp.]
MGWYIGLMSGTSMDGVDAVLARFQSTPSATAVSTASTPASSNTASPYTAHYEHAVSVPLPNALRDELLALNQTGTDELLRAARAAQALVGHYTQAVQQLLLETDLHPDDIIAIGAHGQTVRHLPAEGISIQLNAPALLAEQTGIDVIADFRSRDLAAGGQGAPLVPPFHALLFGSTQARAVVNIGGMANITVLAPQVSTHTQQCPTSIDRDMPQHNTSARFYGFDCGPGNVLMDLWCEKHLQKPYDHKGRWAASGQCQPALLDLLLAEPWLKQSPPKSTGRDLFNGPWLQQKLDALKAESISQQINPADIQATLLEFTVQTIVDAIAQWAPKTKQIIICGGGARNTQLMQRLTQQGAIRLDASVHSSAQFDIHPQHIEAYAFAWLAFAYDQKICAGYPEVTGARQSTYLGARYYK